MKRTIIGTVTAFCAVVVMFAVSSMTVSAADNIAIGESTFPDADFRAYVSENIDKDKDGSISAEEVSNTESIDISKLSVKDLGGIEYFTALKILNCYDCKSLTALDLSKNTALTKLVISSSKITSLNISNCKELRRLECTWVYLSELDLSGNPNLSYLDCYFAFTDSQGKILRTDLMIGNNPNLLKAYKDGDASDANSSITYDYDDGSNRYYLNIDKYTTIVTDKSDKKPSNTPTPTPTAKPTGADGRSLTLDKDEATVVCGDSFAFKATLKGPYSNLTWKSSDEKIATVSDKGRVTGKMAGTVTITCTAGDLTATCKVAVLYKDVTKTSDFWFAPTNYLTAASVVKGYDKQTKFKPANDCTRAQMVTFLYRLQGEPKVKSTTCKFTDVKKSDYFFKPVIWAVEKGITTGVSKTKFNPQGVCTRAQTVTFLWRMADKPAPKAKTNKFKDVKAKDYFYQAVLWASEKKIVAGYNDNTFRPQGKCLRRQMVTFLYKYDKFINGKG
ncbi:MAG: S-layer homology domain-containing protein [Clostridiales bacterium]|nr:S-layer homology domain-containing protein [Clostridiales bacterium]